MIKNIKIKVETDEQNQYVFNKHLESNRGCKWFVDLYGGYDYWSTQDGTNRAVYSRWKGFRHLVIDDDGDLILCLREEYYNTRDEKEITFDEFQEMVSNEPKYLDLKVGDKVEFYDGTKGLIIRGYCIDKEFVFDEKALLLTHYPSGNECYKIAVAYLEELKQNKFAVIK